MYDKEKKIQEIINFVNDHRESMASQIVGRRMLGDGTLTSNERLEELKMHSLMPVKTKLIHFTT